jgi:hypothetical protein
VGGIKTRTQQAAEITFSQKKTVSRNFFSTKIIGIKDLGSRRPESYGSEAPLLVIMNEHYWLLGGYCLYADLREAKSWRG